MRRVQLAVLAVISFALGAAVRPRLDDFVARPARADDEPAAAPRKLAEMNRLEFSNAKPTAIVEGPSLYYVAQNAESARPILVCVAKLQMRGQACRKGESSWRAATYDQVCMCASSRGELPSKEDLYFGPKDEPAYVGYVPHDWLAEWKETKGDEPPASVRQWLDWAESRGHAIPERYRTKK